VSIGQDDRRRQAYAVGRLHTQIHMRDTFRLRGLVQEERGKFVRTFVLTTQGAYKWQRLCSTDARSDKLRKGKAVSLVVVSSPISCSMKTPRIEMERRVP
jgi:hypothetical protein